MTRSLRSLRDIAVALSVLTIPSYAQEIVEETDPESIYLQYCAACHGRNLEGVNAGPLIKEDWTYGRNPAQMYRAIMYGIPGTDMVAWSAVLNERQGRALRDYIIEKQTVPPNNEREVLPRFELADRVLKIDNLTSGGPIDTPWSIEFVDERRILVSERSGALRWIVDGELQSQAVQGTPDPLLYGTSGYMDLAIDPDYERNGWVYLAYSHGLEDRDERSVPGMTKIVRARIDENRWIDEQTLFEASPENYVASGGRWGCRLLFDRDDYLYFSIGDMGLNDDVQRLSKPVGKWFRIHKDGSIPQDNPFVGTPGALPQIFTIGNRNGQGIAQHPETGELWATDHGPMGGDELNVLVNGANYGWPLASYGIDYSGEIVTELTEFEGAVQPITYWTPSPALAAAEFYQGDLFPDWKGSLLVTALAFEEIKRLEIEGHRVVSEEIILKGMGRVRDVKIGSDGSIYAALNRPDAIIRITLGD